jgi:hypothetical protein
MERHLDWSGLLIEADKKSFAKLISRNRKAFTLPNCCISIIKPYPIQVHFIERIHMMNVIINICQLMM